MLGCQSTAEQPCGITANLPDEAIAPYTRTLETGVHFGYAQVDFSRSRDETDHDAVYPMVMSVGWNPYYKNQKRTAVRGQLHLGPMHRPRRLALLL